DQRAQRLLSRQRRLVAALQQPEAVVEPVRDVLQRKRPRSCGGELDGERNTVEVMTDAGERRCVVLRHTKRGLRGDRAIDEKAYRLVFRKRRRRDHSRQPWTRQ